MAPGRGFHDPTKPDKVEAARRRKQALELRLQGKTYQQISDEIGWTSKRYAWRMVMQELRNIPKEEAAELRQIEMERLNTLTDALWTSAMTGDPKAVDAMLKLMERRARMLGLDSPHKISHGAEEGISMIGSIMSLIREADATGDPESGDESEAGDDESTAGDEPGALE